MRIWDHKGLFPSLSMYLTPVCLVPASRYAVWFGKFPRWLAGYPPPPCLGPYCFILLQDEKFLECLGLRRSTYHTSCSITKPRITEAEVMGL